MLEIPRSLIRQVWTVVRKCIRKPFSPNQAIEIHAGAQDLRFWASNREVAVEYCQPGRFESTNLWLPIESLAAFEGRDDLPVAFEVQPDNRIQAKWADSGIPRQAVYESPDQAKKPPFPGMPGRFVPNPPRLLQVLSAALQSVAPDATRYAMNKLQLRGCGEVIATDSRQLLIETGFDFGFDKDLLVPALAVFGCRELPSDQPVEVGSIETHVVIRTGPWTFWLPIDRDARYPDVHLILPQRNRETSHCRIGATDADVLVRALPRLPGLDDTFQPVTVDLNGHVAIRSKGISQTQATEITLTRSECSGTPVRFCLDRNHLKRALQMGFSEIHVVDPGKPLICRDSNRKFVIMPLDPKESIGSSEDAIRVDTGSPEGPTRAPKPERIQPTMAASSTNGSHAGSVNGASNGFSNGHAAPVGAGVAQPKSNAGIADLITEAESLRDSVRELYTRASVLVGAIKRHRKQSKLVATTLASLRQLQKIDA